MWLFSGRALVEAAFTLAGTGARSVYPKARISPSLSCPLPRSPLFLTPSLSILLHSERALNSSSKERRVVDHRYGGREARKWPTIGLRVLFADTSRMALVVKEITADIGMYKGAEMMQVSTRQRRPIALLIILMLLVASSNMACVSSVISADFVTVQVPRIATMPR